MNSFDVKCTQTHFYLTSWKTFGCVPAAVSFFTSRQQGFGCSRGLIQTVVFEAQFAGDGELDSVATFPFSPLHFNALFFFSAEERPKTEGLLRPQCCHRNTVCISQWAIPGLLAFSWNSNSQIELAGRSGKVIVSLRAGLLEDVYGDVSV